jgi:hypothetical protein
MTTWLPEKKKRGWHWKVLRWGCEAAMPCILLSGLMGSYIDIKAGPLIFATAGVWSQWIMLWSCRHFMATLEDLKILGLYAQSWMWMWRKLDIDTMNGGSATSCRHCLAKSTAGIEPTGEAETATATKSKALAPWMQGETGHKVETLWEGKHEANEPPLEALPQIGKHNPEAPPQMHKYKDPQMEAICKMQSNSSCPSAIKKKKGGGEEDPRDCQNSMQCHQEIQTTKQG